MKRIWKVLRNAHHDRLGRCNVCNHRVLFICTDAATRRENLFCPRCRSYSRKRHVVQMLLRELDDAESLRHAAPLEKDLYSATSTDQIWRILGTDRRFHGSELHDDIPFGAPLPNGGTCQNLEELTFEDDSFDIVLTEDVLEHVRYPDRVFKELARILRPGGVHIFTVPMFLTAPTLERVEPREDGPDRMLTEPEWHGDHLHGRSLAYRTFGTDIYDRLSGFGFHTRMHRATPQMRRIGVVDSYVLESRLVR